MLQKRLKPCHQFEALANSGKAYNALAVLAVMFEVDEEDNPLLKPIVDGII
jgi:hypothetical protein